VIATLVNALAVIAGSLLGLLFHSRIGDSLKKVVFTGAGIISLVLGMKMAFESTRIVFLALALIAGGFLGEWLDIEGAILRFGDWLRTRFARGDGDSGSDFAYGFLDASVIFCVGAMALVGSIKAGLEGDYELLLTKSVLDGFVAMMFAAALGLGVAFASLSVLAYQGGLTLAAGLLRPVVTELVLGELTGIGGCLVVMIGINLLGLGKIKTANYLPALLIIVALLALEGLFPTGLL
jgi:uncharacterized membrane protein YqgA involved in biofilm formation